MCNHSVTRCLLPIKFNAQHSTDVVRPSFRSIALIIDNVGENNDTNLLKDLAPGLSFVPPDL